MSRESKPIFIFMVVFIFSLILQISAVAGEERSIVGEARAEAPSSGWLAVDAPLVGDVDLDGWTHFEISTDPGGPWQDDPGIWRWIGGPGEWRRGVFARGMISPGTDYYLRVTYGDPDGVVGANPQIVGPIRTPDTSPNALTVGDIEVAVGSEEIFVVAHFADDANANSDGAVEWALDPEGPWQPGCGSLEAANSTFFPKMCRLRGLSPGEAYFLRVTLTDPDGVQGKESEIFSLGTIHQEVHGPYLYEGRENLALGRAVAADEGWGCCSDPQEIVDGRIQVENWQHGFAFTGGTGSWGGGSPGVKQAVVDFGESTTFNRVVLWFHDAQGVPLIWDLSGSDDGQTWVELASFTEPMCRLVDGALPGSWVFPACAQQADFPAATARYLRYRFDDTQLFNGIHGWLQELEVYYALGHCPGSEQPASTCGIFADGFETGDVSAWSVVP